MKKSFFASLIFVFGVLFVSAGPVLAASLNVGNESTARGELNSAKGFAVVDTNNPVKVAGSLSEFDYYAANTNDFYFILVDGKDGIQWVSDKITPKTIGLGAYEPTKSVAVEAGWNLGVYFAAGAGISYDDGGQNAYYTDDNYDKKDIKKGKKLDYNGKGQRTYSFGATGVADGGSVDEVGKNEDETSGAGLQITGPENGATVEAAGTGNFTVTWDKVSGNDVTYQLEYFKNNTYTGANVVTKWITATEFTVEDAATGAYYLRVRSKDGQGTVSNWSNGKDATYLVYVGDVLPPIQTIVANKAACLAGKWVAVSKDDVQFKNQGQCVAFYNQQIQGHIENLLRIMKQKYSELVIAVGKQVRERNDKLEKIKDQGNNGNGK